MTDPLADLCDPLLKAGTKGKYSYYIEAIALKLMLADKVLA